MGRLTQKNTNGSYALKEDINKAEAVNRLAAYENMFDALCSERNKTMDDIEKLREAGKTKSVTFKQLFADKLKLSEMINRFDFWINY